MRALTTSMVLSFVLATCSAEAKEAYFVSASVLHGEVLLPSPPASDSGATKTDLDRLHAIQDSRTPIEIASAKADSVNETMFLFADVIGSEFKTEAFPAVADLSGHIANDESVIAAPLKALWARPRPFLADPTIHPVCAGKANSGSYPSGHATLGYIEALALIQIVPEKRDAILRRADAYAHNRLVCGVHYPSDLEASKSLAYALHALMTVDPRYQKELEAARRELRGALGPAALAAP